MTDDRAKVINVPPFPPLEWDGYFWTSTINLPAWARFQSRLGPYDSVSSVEASDGTAKLHVSLGTDEPTPPTSEQAAAYQHLLKHQESIRDSILQAVLARYPQWQTEYGYDEDEQEEYMPDVESVEQFKALLGLSCIHVMPVAKDGVAYVGFEFGCTWDNEHGLGAMMHKTRVVEVGGADVSFLEWVAGQDTEAIQ